MNSNRNAHVMKSSLQRSADAEKQAVCVAAAEPHSAIAAEKSGVSAGRLGFERQSRNPCLYTLVKRTFRMPFAQIGGSSRTLRTIWMKKSYTQMRSAIEAYFFSPIPETRM